MNRIRWGGAGAIALVWLACCTAGPPARAATLPSGFQDSVVFDGLEEPTAMQFSPDGRVFVAEKAGRILVYGSLSDPVPEVFADLREQVFDSGDRGLLGLTLHPGFPGTPFAYALYTFDHVLGVDEPGAHPHWGQGPSYEGDSCEYDPEVDACPVSGRLVRLQAVGNHATSETVLVEDWCQQNSSHSIGDLEFGPEGALFASGGDGASFNSPDYGQYGWPQKNQCGDPPSPLGTALSTPTAEGGALRSQDLRTPAPHDPTGLDGTVIRVDPLTGEGLPDNPLAASADANERRIVAYGFRNPFRFSINEDTGEVYASNVGYDAEEEIDRFSTAPAEPYNSGWPCYEGGGPNLSFAFLELDLCEDLYEEPGATGLPMFKYIHGEPVSPDDECDSASGSAVSGSAFYDGESFPGSYHHAFFFADPVRSCIYVMFAGEDGRPDPLTTTPFLVDSGTTYPGVDIVMGPEGDLYYTRLFGPEYGPGSIHRISFFSGNQPPVANLTASPQWGDEPLNARFDAGGSTDADGEDLVYEWDLEGDGSYAAPSADAVESRTFNDSNNHTVAVRVADEKGARGIDRVTVYPGDTPPVPEIVAPAETGPGSGLAGLTWGVGDKIGFEGVAEDNEDGTLLPTNLDWSSRLYHCPGGPTLCHAHPLQAFPSVESGTLLAPEHDLPSYIDLTFTAVDSRGLSASRTIELEPRSVSLEIGSLPAGVTLTAGPVTKSGPFTLAAIEGANVTLSAPQTALIGGVEYTFASWSDGGARVHAVPAVTSAQYTAIYDGPVSGGDPSGGIVEEPPRPETRVVRHPPKRARSTTARFAFAADQADAWFQCMLDQGEFKPCRSPRVYRHLRPGGHALAIRALTPGGKPDPTPVPFSWRVLKARG
ncbi:MAG: PQQ-dependent sugar dehydrogenase [Solirubrobacterales bacterium]